MKKWYFGIALASLLSCDAHLKLIEVKNESDLPFKTTFCDGTPIDGAYLDQPESCLSTVDEEFRIVFEDAGHSGYYRPEWKFHIWLEKASGFPMLAEDRILYAVIFYDGDGEISIQLDKERKLHVHGGVSVKDILYPWAKGTIGRGNPYHEIQAEEIDGNGIKYFDYNGFVGYPSNLKHLSE